MSAYTMREVAEILSVNERTIKNLIARGELKRLKVGRAVRITQQQLDAYLEGASS